MTALFRKIQGADFAYPKWFSPEVSACSTKFDKIRQIRQNSTKSCLVADPAVRMNLHPTDLTTH